MRGSEREVIIVLNHLEGLLNAEGAELCAHGNAIVQVLWDVDQHVDQRQQGQNRPLLLLMVQALLKYSEQEKRGEKMKNMISEEGRALRTCTRC